MNTDYVDEFENYDRKLIKLNSDTAILLHIFKKKPNHHFEDWMVLQDNEEYFKKEGTDIQADTKDKINCRL